MSAETFLNKMKWSDQTSNQNQQDNFYNERDYRQNINIWIQFIRNGKFQKADSIHDKYRDRPKALEQVCLAQFATSYEGDWAY